MNVCGGVNFEYYFLCVDNMLFGVGIKFLYNVMGLFGVVNGFDGDFCLGFFF